jgi:hypothetical protein
MFGFDDVTYMRFNIRRTIPLSLSLILRYNVTNIRALDQQLLHLFQLHVYSLIMTTTVFFLEFFIILSHSLSFYMFSNCYVFLLLCKCYYYVMCSFVSLSILIVTYVPFCVFCLIVLFCVLFVCKCVLDYYHRDIGALFNCLTEVFPCFFLSCKANAKV